MVEEDLDAQDTAEKGTDTQQRWMGTYEFLTVHSRSLTLDHQQPWDIMHMGLKLFPHGWENPVPHNHRLHREEGVCQFALRTRRPGSSKPLPPAAPGADLRLWAPGGQARHLILPADQAGRHKSRSREGRKDQEETDAERKMDRRLTKTNSRGRQGHRSPQPQWDLWATAQFPLPSPLVPQIPNYNEHLRGLGLHCVPRTRNLQHHIYSCPPKTDDNGPEDLLV